MNDIAKLRVRVYTSASILEGNIYKPSNQRLLDVLNWVSLEGIDRKKDFISLSEVMVQDAVGRDIIMTSIYVNKSNIFFVEEIVNLQASSGFIRDSVSGFYPYVEKKLVAIKFYLPQYTLNGKLHYAKKQSPSDLLNSNMQFLPLTDVRISQLKNQNEIVASFIAVNREQILYMEEKSESL